MPSLARSPGDDAVLLSIGQVLARLQGEFPTLSSSKLRFLEVQGIVRPRRTASGYRKFTPDDLDRLRVALTLQRDQYLPLSVIREQLDAAGAGPDGGAPSVPSPIPGTSRRLRREELLREAGSPAQLLNDAITTGLIAGSDAYDDRALEMLRALVALERHGIEPRHLRALRQSAERDIALIDAALGALRRRGDAASRGRAADAASDLAARLADVRRALVRSGLERLET